MERWEQVQRAKGNIEGAEIARGLRKRYGDVPFPQNELRTPETPIEIKRFTKEQREALEKEGYIIYSLTGQSIRSLRESGRRIRSTWHNAPLFADLEALGSMHSEVAINPAKFFLPASNFSLEEQEAIVAKFSRKLGKKVKGVKAIIGQAPDYVELVLQHFDVTQEYDLFTKGDSFNRARTKTPISASNVATVASFDFAGSVVVDFWPVDRGVSDVHAVPLVVPSLRLGK